MRNKILAITKINLSKMLLIFLLTSYNLCFAYMPFNHKKQKKDKEIAEVTNKTKRLLISFEDEILFISDSLNIVLKNYSFNLKNKLSSNNTKLESKDLFNIRYELNIDSSLVDIFLISNSGIIVNTTFLPDLNLDLYSFGAGHKNFLLSIFRNNKFIGESFAFESFDKRLKKYSYLPIFNGQYLIELGANSKRIDKCILDFVDKLHQLADNYENIKFIDVFVGNSPPFSLDNESLIIKNNSMVLQEIFNMKQPISTIEELNGVKYTVYYNYLSESKNVITENGFAIRIISAVITKDINNN